MKEILLYPPLAFIIIFLFSWLMSFVSSKLSMKSQNTNESKYKPYACGEDVVKHRLQPNYHQFFPFAFFFTIMHVVALLIATIPVHNYKISGIIVLFFLISVCGLFILFRKEEE